MPLGAVHLLLPLTSPLAGLERAPARVFAWGEADQPLWLWRGRPLGTVGTPGLGRWLERLPERYANEVAGWKVLGACSPEYEDELRRGDQPWIEATVIEILRSQPDWIAWVERDVDQAPLRFGAMSPEEVASGMRRLALVEAGAPPFVAWPP